MSAHETTRLFAVPRHQPGRILAALQGAAYGGQSGLCRGLLQPGADTLYRIIRATDGEVGLMDFVSPHVLDEETDDAAGPVPDMEGRGDASGRGPEMEDIDDAA